MGPRVHAMTVLLLGLAGPATAAAQAAVCRDPPAWPYSARDRLAAGVTDAMPLPEATASPQPADARRLLDELAARLRALRSAPLPRGFAHVVDARARSLVAGHLRPIDALADRAVALRDAAVTVEALALRAHAHEHVAERLARLGELVELTPAEREALRRWERAMARVERIAETNERVREILERERGAHHCPPPSRGGPDEECRQRIEGRWYAESVAHRQVAIVLYATAVHLARAHHVTGALAWSAAERLRDEWNVPWLREALARQSLFTPAPGEFDAASPGAVLLATAPVSGARLAP